MDDNQLREEIRELEDQLDDANMEKGMLFRQTGLHLSSQKVGRQIKELEEEIERLEKRISDLQKQSI